VLDVIAEERPVTVLDVGAGFGKYGGLAREYAAPARVDAVDAAAPKLTGYDNVYLGDVRDLNRVLPAELPRYDLALFVDVIEHLEKAEGHRVLGELIERARRVLVTTPLGFRRQEIPGQPYETHRSGWYPWDFARRYRLHRWRIFPGHYTRHLWRPTHWQLMALVSRRLRNAS
jgi:SAM-dependent methyltransferase